MVKKYIYCLLFITSLITVSVEAAIVRRAAFDFGSGKTKLQVADVDTDSHHIVNTIFTDAVVVLLSEDLNLHNGKFSDEIQNAAVTAAKFLKDKATEHGATEFAGVATEAYRCALNGQDLINRYIEEAGISSFIIPQDMEGKLGFMAQIEESGFDPQRIVCWDIGSGSFQVTYQDESGQIHIYKGPYGRSTTKNAIITHIKHLNPHENITPNPMNQQEWESSIEYFANALPPIDEQLVAKLKQPNVMLVGMGAHPPKLREQGLYTANDLIDLKNNRLDKTDLELQSQHGSPSQAVTELTLVYSIMRKLDWYSVYYFITNGGTCSALLVAEEFWNSNLIGVP